mmetsp:Transcript_9847/g.26870  ORF Transcript_9847/g.26870 Transcript_9847/m.26870 type:complete len:229 (+) Transcript_9847:457-1143(+)
MSLTLSTVAGPRRAVLRRWIARPGLASSPWSARRSTSTRTAPAPSQQALAGPRRAGPRTTRRCGSAWPRRCRLRRPRRPSDRRPWRRRSGTPGRPRRIAPAPTWSSPRCWAAAAPLAPKRTASRPQPLRSVRGSGSALRRCRASPPHRAWPPAGRRSSRRPTRPPWAPARASASPCPPQGGGREGTEPGAQRGSIRASHSAHPLSRAGAKTRAPFQDSVTRASDSSQE